MNRYMIKAIVVIMALSQSVIFANTLNGGDFMVAGNWSDNVLPTNSLNPGIIGSSVTNGTWSGTATGLAIRQTGGTVSRSLFGWQAFSGMNYQITGGTLTAGGWGLQLVSGSVFDVGGASVNAVGLNTDNSTVNFSSGSLTLSGDLQSKSSTFDFSGGTVSIAGYVLTSFNNATFNFSSNTAFNVTGQFGVNHFATSSTMNIGAGDGSISVGTLEAKNMTIKWASGSGFSFTATNILYEGTASSWESLWDTGRMTYNGNNYTTLGAWATVTTTGFGDGFLFRLSGNTLVVGKTATVRLFIAN